MDENLEWELVKRDHIVNDKWIDFRRSAYRMPDGTIAEPFYSYSRRDYVVIVAQDAEGKYLCVRQYRQGIGEVTNEFPAGGIEVSAEKEYASDDSERASAEDALAAARRELLEETGYESDEWTHLLTIPSNATIADNYAHIFMAKGCKKVGSQELDDTEFLNVHRVDAERIEKWIDSGEFQQMAHVTAWLLAKNRM